MNAALKLPFDAPPTLPRSVLPGDCRDSMRAMESNSIDSIVSDPPYGLSFMGKGWDHEVPGVDFWTEALRVAKPGAFLLAFGGTRKAHRLAAAIEDAGWEIRDSIAWMYGSGFPKHKAALKPAHEPIIVARKPLVGTVARNVAMYGTGAINVDGCRIGVGKRVPASPKVAPGSAHTVSLSGYADGTGHDPNVGRWPANVILDEEAGRALDEMTGTIAARGSKVIRASGIGFGGRGSPTERPGYQDVGGASRYFYCAKASKSERNAAGPNAHPTVKPIALMRYLVRLVTPPGGLVLDPFCGSGSTGVATAHEGFGFIGCELDPAHVEVARARIAHAEG